MKCLQWLKKLIAPEPTEQIECSGYPVDDRVGAAPLAPFPQRKVGTFHFYWYDAPSGLHMQYHRYTLPPTPEPSFRSHEWWAKELVDMHAAGIDWILPVYWGDRPQDPWSVEGIRYLRETWDHLTVHGVPVPTVGCFFDTTAVDGRDLRTDEGKAWLFQQYRRFFEEVPPRQWATVEGRPILTMFTADYTRAFDQSTFTYLYEQFATHFGVVPYIVREQSWSHPLLLDANGCQYRDWDHPILTDASYLWGAAMHGYTDWLQPSFASVGPGYDDSLMPDRKFPITDREGGAFYARAWNGAIQSGKPAVFIETWNEMHEGSGICETVEYGRQYIDMTAQAVAVYKAGG